jgi:hypothetical protein
MFPSLVLHIALGWKEKLVNRNFQQCGDFEKNVQAGVLASVLHIHDGARCPVKKLGQILLRPALILPFAFDFPA